jgi:pimeloyl-ACP methyl ester carboxylesterase
MRERWQFDPVYEGGEGTPLVLLHGFTSTWHGWNPLLPLLEREHHVLAPTLPGHAGGAAFDAAVGGQVEALASWVADWLTERGIDRPHIAGNSLGGWVALELARRGRARSVVALSPGGAWTTPADLRRLVRLFRSSYRLARSGRWAVSPALRHARFRRAALRMAMERGDLVAADDVRRSIRAVALCTALPRALKSPPRPLAAIDALDIPVLVAWSERDRVLPFDRYGVPLLERMPWADHVVLAGVGHVPMSDAPELVASTILGVTRAAERHVPAAGA